MSKQESEQEITRQVLSLVQRQDKRTKKRIKQEYNNLSSKLHGEDLVYEIAHRVNKS